MKDWLVWNEINWTTTFKQIVNESNQLKNIFEGLYISKIGKIFVNTYQIISTKDYEYPYFFLTIYELNQKAFDDWVEYQNPTYKFFEDWKKKWDKKNDWQDKTSGHLFIGGGCEKIN